MPYIYCIGSQPHRPLVNRLSLPLRYAGNSPSFYAGVFGCRISHCKPLHPRLGSGPMDDGLH